MTENEISYKVRKAIFTVYNALGPGLLESVYEKALAHELSKMNLGVETQAPIPVIYDGVKMEVGFRADILVNRKVIIEIKSIEALANIHFKQLITYLKLSDYRLGILVNFNTDDILNSIHRKVDNL